MKTHRISCTTPARAANLASFLTAEGWDATWIMSYGTGEPTVLALCTPEAAELAIAAVGV